MFVLCCLIAPATSGHFVAELASNQKLSGNRNLLEAIMQTKENVSVQNFTEQELELLKALARIVVTEIMKGYENV